MLNARIVAERERQKTLGYDADNDYRWQSYELYSAGISYLLEPSDPGTPPGTWPWAIHWWNPKDRLSNLTRGAALLVAELERIQRLMDGNVPAPVRRYFDNYVRHLNEEITEASKELDAMTATKLPGDPGETD